MGALHRYCGADRELPDRCVREPCQPLGPCADRSAALSSQGLGKCPRPACSGACARRCGLCHQARHGLRNDSKPAGRGNTLCLCVADAVYGSVSRFRRMLEARFQPYVLAVRSTHSLRFIDEWHLVQTDPATMVAELPPKDWQALSAGEGAKGHRLHNWARVPLNYTAGEGFSRWLLARRSLRDPGAVWSLLRICPNGCDTSGTGRCRRAALDHRGMLPSREG